jgi:alpha-mannosidase
MNGTGEREQLQHRAKQLQFPRLQRKHWRPFLKRKVTFFFGSIILFVLGIRAPMAVAQAGQESSVFRIGAFDRSSIELAQENPKQPVTFVVGQSSPAKDWYASQPVQFLPAPGAHDVNKDAAARTITFTLQDPPAAAYSLHIAVLVETSSVPALRVTINGKHGIFYLHPTLDENAGDWATSWFSIYSHADLVFAFPGTYLRPGVNTISLQAVEEVDKGIPDAGLTYDALELHSAAIQQDRQEPSPLIVPTIFYQQKQHQLEEMVEVFVRHEQPAKPGSEVELRVGEKDYHQAFHGDQDFGEEKIAFSVKEFPEGTRALLAWNIDGQQRKIDQVINPGKKWTLFLVPSVHLDIGYSDYQAKVGALHSRVIDEAMDQMDRHPDFRFSIDGEWSAEQFMKTRTPEEQKRMINAVQKEKLFVPPQYADLLMGFPTAETLIRSLYAGANFSRIHGTPFNYVNITDTPTYSWSYASIVAAAGIDYLLAGGNNIRAPAWLQGHLTEKSPMWWEGPDGHKVLLWYSRHYEQMHYLFGLPPLLSAGRDTLPLFLQLYEHPNYRASATIIFGSEVENTDLFPQQAELAQQWKDVYAYPKIQYSGFYSALKNIAVQFGNDIPTIRGDGGPYWEDGVGADAYYAAMERENEARAQSAEKLATLSTVVNPRVAADKSALDQMWTHMVVMDEHVSSSWNSVAEPKSAQNVGQLAVKHSQAIDARALADLLLRNSMASIVDSIATGEGSRVVFNTLNWKRSGEVSIDLATGDELVDLSTGKVVPVEVIESGNDMRRVRFVAQDVPPVGYKVFFTRHTGHPLPAPEVATSTVLESPYYRVELDPATGAINSIYDKELQRELVNRQSPYRFGQYLYVTGANSQLDSQLDFLPPVNTAIAYPMGVPQPQLQINPAHDGRLISVTRTPTGWVARMEATATNTPRINCEVRLFDNERKIELIEDVDKKEVQSKEAVYLAFPFAMDNPTFQYEIQTGVVDPSKDMYPGAGHEWFSVQHWVAVQQGDVSATVMPLDVPVVTLGDINRGAWPSQFGQRPGSIFSYAMNNYWYTGTRAGQGGNFHFRYVITSATSTDSTRLSRMGWEEMTTLEANEVVVQDKSFPGKRPLDKTQGSFLDVQDPDILLETWKPSEDGNGTILRFLDLGGTERPVIIGTPFLHLKSARRTDVVERDREPLPLIGAQGFKFTIHPREIVTVRIVGASVLPPPAY